MGTVCNILSAWYKAKRPSEREHIGPFFSNNKSKFQIFQIKYSKNLSHLRWTVDRENDLEFVRTIVSKIKKRPILLGDILDLLSREPDLIEINKDHIVEEGLKKSLKEDKIIHT